MLKNIAQNAVMIGAIIAGATISGMTAPLLASPRGAYGPAVVEAASIVRAILGTGLSLIVCTALAVLVGRVQNTVVGLFVLGGGLFGLAWRLATVDELVHSGSLTAVVVETALWSAVVLGLTLAVFRLSGPLEDVEPDPDGHRPHAFKSSAALKSAAAGLLVIPVVWIVAQTPVKGQVIGAVFCGGMVAGLAGRLLSPHVQPILLFATPILFGAVGHVIGIMRVGDGGLDAAWVAGDLAPLSLPMPLDYVVGTFLGVSVGLGWARSFLHHDEEHA